MTVTPSKTQPDSPESIFAECVAAAEAAVAACTPRPMIVGSPSHPLGNDIDPTQPVYYIEDGMCGFGYVTVKPARGAFVKMLQKQGIGYKGYYGGWQMSARVFAPSLSRSQSYEKARAAAAAAAKVLNRYCISAYAEARLD